MGVIQLSIDGTSHEVSAGRNLLQIILELGYDLPYFCWHPALGSVGACRQCAVRLYSKPDDDRGRIVMACMTPAADGQRISLSDPEATEFRKAIIEWLMTNHPHDCPVCDEGGECHLQDMTVMTNHNRRRTRFPKRTFNNQNLGPLLHHEMNRCIQCYRCVRFYADFADGKDLQPFASRNRVWFGRFEPGKLESPFSGNLAEVCPTGVFTDKVFRSHFARKWDLQTAPSICPHCSLGCNTLLAERYGQVRRVRNRYHGLINGYFLCDRGRYGFGYINADTRVRRLAASSDGQKLNEDLATKLAADWLPQNGLAIGVGSPRASLEANHMLRQLVGPDRFCNGMAVEQAGLVNKALALLRKTSADLPSLRQVERCDAVFVIGEDVAQSAPMLALALRQAIRQQPLVAVDQAKLPRWDDAASRLVEGECNGPLFVATPQASPLDARATQSLRAAPADIARLAFAVAHQLDPNTPAVADLSDETASLAKTIAETLESAERPLVVTGVGQGDADVLDGAAAVAAALCREDRRANLFVCLPEANSAGVSLLEPAGIERALALAKQGADTLVVLENDLYRRASEGAVDALFSICKNIIVLDHSQSRTCAAADLLLPAASFAEASGTLVNNEGRAQRFFQVYPCADHIQPSWRWLRNVGQAADRPAFSQVNTLDKAIAALAESNPIFAPIIEAAPPATASEQGQKVPRQSHRYSGRTSMQAHLNVHEPELTRDEDSPMAFSMEGQPHTIDSSLYARYWAPGWNSVQALNKFQTEIGASLLGGDPGQRLIPPSEGCTQAELREPPQAFVPRTGQLLVVPSHALFGSEELSNRSEPIASLASGPVLHLHPADAQELGLAGDELELVFGQDTWRLRVQFADQMPRGVAAATIGSIDQAAIELPAWAKVESP